MTAALAIPAAVVEVDGRDLTAQARLLTLRVASRFGAPTQCEVTLHDPASTWPATPGGRLSVRVGGTDAPLFEGEVTAVSFARTADGVPVSRIRGYDRSYRLRTRQTVRVFESVTATELGSALCAAVDVQLRAANSEGPRFARIVQHRQSDFDLLVEVAARAGCLVATTGDTVVLSTLDGEGEDILLRYGANLHEVTVESNVDRLAGSVTADGWDPATAEAFTSTVDKPGTGPEVHLLDGRAAGLGEATAAAQLVLDSRAKAALTVRGTAAGDTRIRAGARIVVSGLAPTVDGRFTVAEAVHSLDGNGFLTTFDTRPPPPPRPDPGSVVTLGRVVAVDDPQRRGRVRVALPAWGNLDAGWLGVICPGAGRGKGIVALPDVDDLVAVALPHADPAAGLVLGSLFGTLAPPDPGVDGAATRRFTLHTADGQSVVIDDAAHSLRLADRTGSFVELAPGAVRLHAQTDLVVEAPGHALTIRAATVDFEHTT
jgi:phage protein D/phage baseplate assembly protein gpV